MHGQMACSHRAAHREENQPLVIFAQRTFQALPGGGLFLLTPKALFFSWFQFGKGVVSPSVKDSPRYTRLTSGSRPRASGLPARKIRPLLMMYARSVTIRVSRTLWSVTRIPMPERFRSK